MKKGLAKQPITKLRAKIYTVHASLAKVAVMFIDETLYDNAF